MNLFIKFQSSENCYFIIYEELDSQFMLKKFKKLNLKINKNIDLQFFKNSNKKTQYRI